METVDSIHKTFTLLIFITSNLFNESVQGCMGPILIVSHIHATQLHASFVNQNTVQESQ